jgi:hypothetical protein
MATLALVKSGPPRVELTDADHKILDLVETSLQRGIELYRWWRETDSQSAYSEPFELARSFNPCKRAIGFYDRAHLSFGEIPVIGVTQETTFEVSPLPPAAARDQIRNFVLHYLLRVADYRTPSAFSLRDLRQPGGGAPDLAGWGYSQCYYKLRGSGQVGKFPPLEQSRIIDLREIGDVYDWVVLRARLFNVGMDISPFGDGTPHLEIPLAAFTEEYLVASPEFIIHEDDPEPGVIGRYGYGYATLHDPAYSNGPLLWGPGRFSPGFESFVFEVHSNGETVVSSPFAVNRPERIFGVSPDPVELGMRVADLFSFGLASRLLPGLKSGFDPLLSPVAMIDSGTGGLAGKLLGLNIDNVERYFLFQHFMSAYSLLTGALLTYSQVADWTAPEDQMPAWVREGRSELISEPA